MAASRGDTKPCIYSGCSGTMQFKRPTEQDAQTWLCSVSPKHLQRPAENRTKARATASFGKTVNRSGVTPPRTDG
jgi:hypothetical protein